MPAMGKLVAATFAVAGAAVAIPRVEGRTNPGS
jgi:hypothetical protein